MTPKPNEKPHFRSTRGDPVTNGKQVRTGDPEKRPAQREVDISAPVTPEIERGGFNVDLTECERKAKPGAQLGLW